VYIEVVDPKTGQLAEDNIFRYIGNTYDSMLEQVDTTGKIAGLRKQYSTVKSVTTPVEDNWFRGLDIRQSSDADLADRASLALRRLDSRAQSRTTYGQMYRGLENYARQNGYKGADAADVSNFYLSTVEDLYGKTTPEASFRGGIVGGVRSVFENIFDFGEANVKDKQRALRGLLDIEDVSTPQVNPASADTPEFREPTTGESMSANSVAQRAEDSLNESLPNSIDITDNPQGGFARFFGENPRTSGLQDEFNKLDNELTKLDRNGVNPESRVYKRLLDAREKISELISSSR